MIWEDEDSQTRFLLVLRTEKDLQLNIKLTYSSLQKNQIGLH